MTEKTAYLGPIGTYSEMAARALCGDAERVPYPSFPAIFSALESGEVSCAVIPVENTLNGAVAQNLDLLQEHEEFYAQAACSVKIDHRLVTLKGADKSKIKRIYSHEQAFGQCSRYLAEHFGSASLLQTSSTASCLKMIRSEEDAGIIGAQCRQEGYELSEETISDEKSNFTRFVLVRRGEPSVSVRSKKIFFTVTCLHKVGALTEVLTVLKNYGINMTEIESRPIKDRQGEFRFFIEIEGDYSNARTRAALAELKGACSELRLLGCY